MNDYEKAKAMSAVRDQTEVYKLREKIRWQADLKKGPQ